MSHIDLIPSPTNRSYTSGLWFAGLISVNKIGSRPSRAFLICPTGGNPYLFLEESSASWRVLSIDLKLLAVRIPQADRNIVTIHQLANACSGGTEKLVKGQGGSGPIRP